MRPLPLGCTLALLAASTLAGAQNFSTSPCNDGNGSSSWFGHEERACEVRRTVLPLGDGRLSVTGRNGNIEVIGEDRSDIALEARVTAQGSSHDDALARLHAIKIITSGDIHAEIPNETGWTHHGGSVSFKLLVPHRIADAQLRTSNGNITASSLQGLLNASSSNGNINIAHIGGEVRVSTTNGGLSLQELAGTVHAETTNGGVEISLEGDRWRGSGLFAKSTNGGVNVKASDRFAAHLVADTTNGGISVGFPISIQGKVGHHIDTDLNGGGPPVHLETTNGGISINRL